MTLLQGVISSAAVWLIGTQAARAMAQPVNPASPLNVDLGYANYQGAHNTTTGLNVWKGIRYAAPPVGELRWRDPSPPTTASKGTINATVFGPKCPQGLPAPFSRPQLEDEDCLFLNVYAPTTEPGKELPVLVWIHGGGYGARNGQEDMSEIINENQNSFVGVAIQYRLGAFGFLASDEVEKNGVLNAGILDMAFALQWVQDNVGKFGGDATQVTISGVSAGAGAVGLLSIAKNGTIGTSLFRNVIAASPYFPSHYKYNAPQPTRSFDAFTSQSGCSNSTNALACLRGKDSTTLQLVNQNMNLNSFYGHWTFLPVTDNSFLTTLPSIALANKRVNGENILVGNNANEGALFVPPSINTIDALENWLHDAFPTFSDVDIQAVLTAYPSSNLPVNPSDTTFETPGTGPATAINISSLATGQQQRANNIYAEATFVCPSYWLNDAFTTQNRKSYHYQYSVPSGQHGDDVTAFFGPAKPNQPPAFTAVFRHIWGNFSVAASPARAVEYWPTWVEGSMSQLLNLNTTGGTPYVVPTITGGNVTQFMEPGVQNAISVANAKTWEGGRGARCDFWARIAEQVPT